VQRGDETRERDGSDVHRAVVHWSAPRDQRVPHAPTGGGSIIPTDIHGVRRHPTCQNHRSCAVRLRHAFGNEERHGLGRKVGPMLAICHSSTIVGLEAFEVEVEVDIARGLPAFDLVGLPEAAVKESRVRVRSAIEHMGFAFPMRRVTVNLAPADVRKFGAGFDVAIAVAVLAASGEVPAEALIPWVMIGELSLNGSIRPVRGVLTQVLGAKRRGARGVIVPYDNAAEAAVVEGIDVRVAPSLRAVIEFLRSEGELEPARAGDNAVRPESTVDLADVRGQSAAKRALEIVAAGGHNVLFSGPPGGGKTMLARTIPGLLPAMSFDESLETTAIHSVAGLLRPGVPLMAERPFRAPHHTASAVGLLGGGEPPRPGEIALAHNGVLFLDELPEFLRDALEGLREPLEDGCVTIVRARSRTTFPAKFTLVAAMNPCPCGFYGDPSDRCSCSDDRIKKYRARISGPLMDRIDLFVPLPPVRVAQLGEPPDGPHTSDVRARVVAARERQRLRPVQRGEINSRLASRSLNDIAALDAESRALLSTASDRLGLSARAATRVLRVARTIADIEGVDAVASAHVAEAIGYRTPDGQ